MEINRRRFYRLPPGALGVASRPPQRKPPFPELEAAGRPGDIGLAQRKAFAAKINDNLDFYIEWLSGSGGTSRERLLEPAGSFAPVLEVHFPDMLEEIDGVARGSGLSLDEILLINARTDILAIVEAEVAMRKIPACTALAIEGGDDHPTTIALCQNWDWDPLLADAPVVLRSPQPTDYGPALVTLVEAGMIGKIGFNQHRLGVCLNFLSHRADGWPGDRGVPIHCLLRAVPAMTSWHLRPTTDSAGTAKSFSALRFHTVITPSTPRENAGVHVFATTFSADMIASDPHSRAGVSAKSHTFESEN